MFLFACEFSSSYLSVTASMCKFLRHADPYLILAINDNPHTKTSQASAHCLEYASTFDLPRIIPVGYSHCNPHLGHSQ
jgi:hypothetical protein